MKKVLFVIDTLRMGGAEKSLVTLLKAIDKKKYNIDLLVFEKGGVLEAEVPNEINIMYSDEVTQAMTLEFRKYGNILLKKGKMLAYLQRILLSLEARNGDKERFGWERINKYIPELQKQYDVAISYLEGIPAYYVIDKVKADKKISWIHTDMSKRKMAVEERKYYDCFNYIVTISEVCKNAFIKSCPEISERISIIENIVLKEEVLKKATEKADFKQWIDGNIQIVTVGRLEEVKGIDIGVRACKILKDRGIPVCWHVYGKGSQQEYLEKLIKENMLEGIFCLEGVVINPYPYMKQADIIVQPSRIEGKSIVLDEAKLLGKAIVVTNYPSVSDQIVNNKTGIIVETTPKGIAEGVIDVVEDSQLKKFLERTCKDEESREEAVLKSLYAIVDC